MGIETYVVDCEFGDGFVEFVFSKLAGKSRTFSHKLPRTTNLVNAVSGLTDYHNTCFIQRRIDNLAYWRVGKTPSVFHEVSLINNVVAMHNQVVELYTNQNKT